MMGVSSSKPSAFEMNNAENSSRIGNAKNHAAFAACANAVTAFTPTTATTMNAVARVLPCQGARRWRMRNRIRPASHVCSTLAIEPTSNGAIWPPIPVKKIFAANIPASSARRLPGGASMNTPSAKPSDSHTGEVCAAAGESATDKTQSSQYKTAVAVNQATFNMTECIGIGDLQAQFEHQVG